MSLPFDPSESGMKVGIEIHQQLATTTKLFCSCPIVKSEDLLFSFERRLRPSQSELGRIDPAAVFEFNKGKVNRYRWNPESSCLVDADEEPPHPMNSVALQTSLLISLMLEASVIDEVHVMRKLVIDGSNTAGFQRTSVVGLGGRLAFDGKSVGVQSITVEEDSSRVLGEDDECRQFALDRLGVPLVEIALDPMVGYPGDVESAALHLGRALRSTGRVARGLGTIRQDLNVSVMGGEVVEVKGVQKLNLIAKVVRYEGMRQMGLIRVAEEMRMRGIDSVSCRTSVVTGCLRLDLLGDNPEDSPGRRERALRIRRGHGWPHGTRAVSRSEAGQGTRRDREDELAGRRNTLGRVPEAEGIRVGSGRAPEADRLLREGRSHPCRRPGGPHRRRRETRHRETRGCVEGGPQGRARRQTTGRRDS